MINLRFQYPRASNEYQLPNNYQWRNAKKIVYDEKKFTHCVGKRAFLRLQKIRVKVHPTSYVLFANYFHCLLKNRPDEWMPKPCRYEKSVGYEFSIKILSALKKLGYLRHHDQKIAELKFAVWY